LGSGLTSYIIVIADILLPEETKQGAGNGETTTDRIFRGSIMRHQEEMTKAIFI